MLSIKHEFRLFIKKYTNIIHKNKFTTFYQFSDSNQFVKIKRDMFDLFSNFENIKENNFETV